MEASHIEASDTGTLVSRFLRELTPLRPVAVWAHGSLAGGDYQEGRSDLDLIAMLPGKVTAGVVWRIAAAHARLRRLPLAAALHCTYLTASTAADPARRHVTFAHQELFRRSVTPVTRRELHSFGRVLHGGTPSALLPPVTDRELGDFVLRDQRDFWRPAVDNAPLWTRDIWVDLGLVTFARACVTVREGRLISKREALDLLPGLGAPAEVVEDIRSRRYGAPVRPPNEEWTARRARLTRDYLGPEIDALTASYD
ncbi:nucleotidyltransferase domain-containing protein [Streptomyces fuscichromogenes]|uniref:nucleotidyltransferase domain-containing protein n=1 Tax=Streptomyces fuscichromogenes TaxID=1324013 RepID=UPI0016700EC6|nr:nucleotidyltransferase domain-containing protein [Streptomyces fuscichromogenes]